MRSPFLGEFMGTLVLILLGNGVVAGSVLKQSKAENGDWMVITTGWGFAVLCGIFTAILFGSPDAHLNPAITLASALQTGNYNKLWSYPLAQVLGAMVGAALVWLFYYPHWKVTPDAIAKRAAFCTTPAIRHHSSNFFCEVLGTAVLVLVAGAINSKLVFASGSVAGFPPYLVSCLVWSIGLSLGGTTGYAINPARDFGPRIAHTLLPIAGKTDSDWNYAFIPIVGPCLGALLAALLLKAIGA